MSSRQKSAALLYSGGKDSTYACGRLLDAGYKVVCLITIKSSNKDSYMLHTSNIEMAQLGAEAFELPIVFGETPGEKETELEDISKTIRAAQKDFGFEIISTGALASNYQRERVERIANSLGLEAVSPLWQRDQIEYLRSLCSDGYQYVLTSVSCNGLDESFLGKIITSQLTEEIIRCSVKYKFNAAFEGGEAETIVFDCPLFRKKKIKILESEKYWDGYAGRLEIRKAILVNK